MSLAAESFSRRTRWLSAGVGRSWRGVGSVAAVVSLAGSSVACGSSLDLRSEATATSTLLDSAESDLVPRPQATVGSTPTDLVGDVTSQSSLTGTEPIVIAHRGASAERPENTLAAFQLAIDLGADYVEPDIVMTSDGHAIVRHEHQLDFTTDVADVEELADKRTTKIVAGQTRTGWFAEDLTLDEIKLLRAVERDPELRPQSAQFDGQEEIPTLREVLELVVMTNQRDSVDVGIYPELKIPGYLSSLGLDAATAVLSDLEEFGFASADDEALVQSFEVTALRDIDERSDLRLVQLFATSGGPADRSTSSSTLTYAEMATPTGLAAVAEYADGVGVEKNSYIIPLDQTGALDEGRATSFVSDAHAEGLFVHAYTFRAENQFLPTDYRSGGAATERGDVVGEVQAFLRTGIDGFFIDHVDLGRAAVSSD